MDQDTLNRYLATANSKNAEAQHALTIKQDELRKLKDRLETLNRIWTMLSAVTSGRRSWRTPDPGKWDECFFFVDKVLNRVVVEELVEGISIFTDYREWRAYCDSIQASNILDYDHVRPGYALVSFNEIATEKCGVCGSILPIIETYRQTRDTLEGDEWTKSYVIGCPTCGNISFPRGEPEVRSSRF